MKKLSLVILSVLVLGSMSASVSAHPWWKKHHDHRHHHCHTDYEEEGRGYTEYRETVYPVILDRRPVMVQRPNYWVDDRTYVTPEFPHGRITISTRY